MEFKAKDRRCEGQSVLQQTRLAEMYLLNVFVEICEKYGLRYFLVYGTLIGAMRHNGFIPWDDDIDIGMPIDDYKNFIKLAPRILPQNLLLEHPSTVAGSICCYAKIRDRSSFFCERNVCVETPCGFFLDIFPFEKLPALPIHIYRPIARLCATSAWSYRVYLRKFHRTAWGILWGFLMASCWWALHFGLRVILCFLKFPFGAKWKNAPENGMVQMQGVDDAVIFPVTKHVFEDGEYCVPRDSDAFLTQIFGDWRQLPPEKDRVWHADIICPTTPPRAWWAMPYNGGES